MPHITKRRTHRQVAQYYGKVLKSKQDLKTSACCTLEKLPAYVQEPLQLIEEEIQTKYYGCGTPFPLVLRGMNVLDLGCGTGRDCFVLSYLVGESGRVVGVDMTEEQLEIARRYLPVQMKKFGFQQANVEFHKGYIEELDELGLPEAGFDLVVSNCVVNLSPDKEAVLQKVFRLLKEGGEFFFSDVYCDRRLPAWTKEDPVLLGECLGGSLYWKDFIRLARRTGFLDPRVFACSKIDLFDPETIEKIGFANFSSITYRLFKLPQLEDACEDYGQVATYLGTIPESPHRFILDTHHVFESGKPLPVCANTAAMLQATRFAPHFDVLGDTSTHYGIFAGCGESMPSPNSDNPAKSCC